MAIAINKLHTTATLKSHQDGIIYCKENDIWKETSSKLYSGLTAPSQNIGKSGDYYKELEESTNYIQYSDNFSKKWILDNATVEKSNIINDIFYSTPSVLSGTESNTTHSIYHYHRNNGKYPTIFSIYIKPELCHKTVIKISDTNSLCGISIIFDLYNQTSIQNVFNTSSSYIISNTDGGIIPMDNGVFRIWIKAQIKYATQLKLSVGLISETGDYESFTSSSDYRLIINNAQLSLGNNLTLFVPTNGKEKREYTVKKIYQKNVLWDEKNIQYYCVSNPLTTYTGQNGDIASYESNISLSPFTILGTGGVSYIQNSNVDKILAWDNNLSSYVLKIHPRIYRLPYATSNLGKLGIIMAIALNQNSYQTYNYGGTSYNPYSYSTDYGINPGGCYSLWNSMNN